jgi:hypothetical protein
MTSSNEVDVLYSVTVSLLIKGRKTPTSDVGLVARCKSPLKITAKPCSLAVGDATLRDQTAEKLSLFVRSRKNSSPLTESIAPEQIGHNSAERAGI